METSAPISGPTWTEAAETRRILEAVLQANQTLVTQNQALQELFKRTFTSNVVNTTAKPDRAAPFRAPSTEYLGDSSITPGSDIQRNSEIWKGIFEMSAGDSEEFMRAFFHGQRPTSVAEALSPKAPWAHWSYAASFPYLARFLEKKMRFHCQLEMEDLYSTDAVVHPAKERRHALHEVYCERRDSVDRLWGMINGRGTLTAALDANAENRVSARLFTVVDLSPLVLSALLGSTPRSDLSYMVAFIERHLKLSNWAKVSLLKYGDMDWNSYTFEYHFSFFYVSPKYSDTESIKQDPRGCRRSASFGRERASRTRSIHEETVSFLLVGHFRDVTTCVQLAESYYNYDPYAKQRQPHSFRHYDLSQPPGLMLLSWIAVELHHVLWRWQSAIEAVENEITSSAQVVFMEDKSDLMADDPQFSLSKTYFWALQAYKLFEETLQDTISTWRRFKQESLPRLNDPRISIVEWETNIQEIGYAVHELEVKVRRIQKRQEEVNDLRKGLISASALFDSRTSVRQGENIRLLTYITILFFPLSFATSIFGMQFMGENRRFVVAFAIALPSITIATALLVSNLETILDVFSAFSDRGTGWLRRSMRYHRRQGWKDKAIALQQDEAMRKAPVRKARRQSSGWVYALFMLEFLLVSLPITETIALLKSIGLRRRDKHKRVRSSTLTIVEKAPGVPDSERQRRLQLMKEKIYQSVEEQKKKEQRKKEKERGTIIAASLSFKRKFNRAMTGTTNMCFRIGVVILRLLLAPVWLLLLLVEYLMVSVGILLGPRSMPTASDSSKPPPPSSTTPAWKRAWEVLGLDAILPLRSPKLVTEMNNEELEAATRHARVFSTPRATPHVGTFHSPNPSGSDYFSNLGFQGPPGPISHAQTFSMMGRRRTEREGSDETTLRGPIYDDEPALVT